MVRTAVRGFAAMVMLVAAVAEEAAPSSRAPTIASAREAMTQALIGKLGAEDPDRRAWAVHEIGSLGLVEARDPLLALLAARTDAIHDPGRVCELALDALVRLPGSIPPAVVPHAQMVARSEVPLLILMAREPVAMRAQLESLLSWELHADATWLAIRELLAPQRSSALAEELARNLVLHVTVAVRDAGAPEPAAGAFGARSVDARPITMRAGMAPVVVYRLTFAPEPGSIVLLDGFRTIHWVRREYAVGGSNSWSEPAFNRDEARVDLLSRLSQPPLGDAPPASTRLSLAWTTADDYHDRLVAVRDRLVAQRRALFAQLGQQALLPSDADTRFPAAIALEVHDERAQHSEALPIVAYPAPPPPPMRF